MEQRTLGAAGPSVSAISLGCMGMSDFYGPADDQESLSTIRAALDAGVSLLDTADFYGNGHNELLIAEVLKERRREDVVLSVKFGGLRDPKGGFIGIDGRPASVKNFLTYSLRRLRTEYIDIYRPGRVDPHVPVEETVGAVAEMIKAGYVRHLGLSEAGAETIRRAHAVHPVVDVQMEYSLMSRSLEQNVLRVCRELGIGVTAYGVLSRGLLSGHWAKDRELSRGDFRAYAPRFGKANVERNLALGEELRSVAGRVNATVAQVAIAWVLARGRDIVPLVGARRRDRLTEALGAMTVRLTPEDIRQIESAVPAEAVAGDRYPTPMMATLDSER